MKNEKQITLRNKKIAYTLRKNKRARGMRLVVNCDGTVVVTTPFGFHETLAEKFIREKSRWLFSKLAFFKQCKGEPILGFSKKNSLTNKKETLPPAVE